LGFKDRSMNVPWSFAWDANGDGRITISDALSHLAQLFFLPGDSLIYAAIGFAPDLAGYLEFGGDSYRGWFSGVVSLLAWIAVLITYTLGSSWVESIGKSSEAARRKALGYSDREK
jgi:hypothetical protein